MARRVRSRCRRRRLSRARRLHWPVHLAGWLLAAVPVVLLAGWAWVAVAPVGFEVVLMLAVLRVTRPALPGGGNRGRGRGNGGGAWGAGDREPRRPLPTAGSGAAAVPLPAEPGTA